LASLPGQLGLTFAFRAVLESRELREKHGLKLRLTTSMGDHIAALEVSFRVEDPEGRTEEAALAVPVPLHPFRIEKAGLYLIEVTFDERAIGTFPVRIEHPFPAE